MVSVAAATNADGRLEVFGADNAGTLKHTWQTAPDGSCSPPWPSLGSGRKIVSVGAATNADGRLEVFGADSAGTLGHMWQLTPGGGWSPNFGQLRQRPQNRERRRSNKRRRPP